MAFLDYTDSATTADIAGNVFLDALGFSTRNGYEMWGGGTVTYALHPGERPADGAQTGTWTDGLSAAIEQALQDISAVSGLTFAEAGAGESADIDFWAYSGRSLGYSYLIEGSGVYVNGDIATPEGLAYGGYDYITVIHELLHNVGLDHPFDDAKFPGVSNSSDTGSFELNQNLYTVMSYNDISQNDANGARTTGWGGDNYGYQVLGTFDIAFLQAVYGVNTSHATGNDDYILPTENAPGTYFKAIWDAGGTDWIRNPGDGDSVIDLRAATLDPDDGIGAGGHLSRVEGIYGGFNIANGVVIENAEGGSGVDLIQGNDADNIIRGKKGNDELRGAKGADDLLGGNGADLLVGNGGRDTLDGQAGNDKLRGGSGKDWIIGGGGDDALRGGGKADVFVFDDDDGTDRIKDFELGLDLIDLSGAVESLSEVEIDQNAKGVARISFGETVVLVEAIAQEALTDEVFIL